MRTRDVGWWFGNTTGSSVNNGGGGQAHGAGIGSLVAGGVTTIGPIQTVHALLGGASVFARGLVSGGVLEPTRFIDGVLATHAQYLTVSVHLRSAGNIDLPGQLQFFCNDLWPTAAAVPNPNTLSLADWAGSGLLSAAWTELEELSPLMIPTPPPGFSTGGAAGLRYEYRRVLGRLPCNFFAASITNLGSVTATEWGVGLYLRSHP